MKRHRGVTTTTRKPKMLTRWNGMVNGFRKGLWNLYGWVGLFALLVVIFK